MVSIKDNTKQYLKAIYHIYRLFTNKGRDQENGGIYGKENTCADQRGL